MGEAARRYSARVRQIAVRPTFSTCMICGSGTLSSKAAQFNTAPPYNLNEGLHITATGENQPNKRDPRPTIQQAFAHAGIQVNGGGSAGAGEFIVALAVGRRPIILGDKPSFLTLLGRWLARLGQSRW